MEQFAMARALQEFADEVLERMPVSGKVDAGHLRPSSWPTTKGPHGDPSTSKLTVGYKITVNPHGDVAPANVEAERHRAATRLREMIEHDRSLNGRAQETDILPEFTDVVGVVEVTVRVDAPE